MSDQDPAVQMWAETGLSTSARSRRLQDELAEVRRLLTQALSGCEELGRALSNATIANHHLRQEIGRLRERPWIVARDGGRYCESCEQEIRRGEAYEFQPGTGGLMQHIHCPIKEADGG